MTILVDPTAEGLPAPALTASRLEDLRGRRVGILDNTKHNSEYFLAAVAEGLAERFGCEITTVRKKTYTKPAESAVLQALAGSEAVVTAIGD